MFSKRFLLAAGLVASFCGAGQAETVSYSFTGTITEQILAGGSLVSNKLFNTPAELIGETISGQLFLDFALAPAPTVQPGYYQLTSTDSVWQKITVVNPNSSVFASDAFASENYFSSFILSKFAGDENFQAFDSFRASSTTSTGNLTHSFELALDARGPSPLPSLFSAADPRTVTFALGQANENNYGRVTGFDGGIGYTYAFTFDSFVRDVVAPPAPPPPPVMTPVPEPQTYALMLAGLAMCAWVIRRKREL